MKKTDALIDSLSSNLEPVSRAFVALRLAGGVAAGAAAAVIMMLVLLNLRPDLGFAVGTAIFWIKLAYTLATAVTGFWTVERLARPGASAGAQGMLECLPLVAMVSLATITLFLAPAGARRGMILGHSAVACPWLIVMLSLPILAGGIWAMRGLAPVRPIAAGVGVGVLAGSAAAAIYGFHCDESAAPFVAIFYTLGIAASGLLGAAIGRVGLRW